MNAASSPLTSLSNPSTSAGSSGFGGVLGAAGADATTSAPGCDDAPSAGGEAMVSPDAEAAGLPDWSKVATEVAMSSRREVAASSLRKSSVSEGMPRRFEDGRRELAIVAEVGLAAL
jgi:hypothetical protein